MYLIFSSAPLLIPQLIFQLQYNHLLTVNLISHFIFYYTPIFLPSSLPPPLLNLHPPHIYSKDHFFSYYIHIFFLSFFTSLFSYNFVSFCVFCWLSSPFLFCPLCIFFSSLNIFICFCFQLGFGCEDGCLCLYELSQLFIFWEVAGPAPSLESCPSDPSYSL